MSSRQIIPCSFDQSTSRRVVVVGTELANPDAKQQMTLYYGTKILFQATIYTALPSVGYAPDPAATWLFGFHDVPFSDQLDYVVSNNSMFNIADDWTGLNVAAGKICFRVDCDTPELKARLQAISGATTPMYGNLWMLTSEGNVLIASWLITVAKTYIDPTTAKHVVGITHLTTDAAAELYVPKWGDESRWYWNGTGWEYKFPDTFWREIIPDLVDGNVVFRAGNPIER
jgi:hypothetical protein